MNPADELTSTNPVIVINSVVAETVFGKMYKYDLPKYYAQIGYPCYYVPESCFYIVLYSGAQKV